MRNKKHIDRVFQEKLKDLEVSPSPKVWKNIKNELAQEGQSKKAYPIWIRLAGIAALLLILFSIGNLILTNDQGSATPDTTIVNTENTITNEATSSTPVDEKSNGIVTNDTSDKVSKSDPANESGDTASEAGINNTGDDRIIPEKEQADKISSGSNNRNKMASDNTSNVPNKSYDKNGLVVDTNDDVRDNNRIVNTTPTNSAKANNITTNKKRDKDATANKDANAPITHTKDGLVENMTDGKDAEIDDMVPSQEFNADKIRDGLDPGSNDRVVMNQSPEEEDKDSEEDELSENKMDESPSIEEEIAQTEDIIEKEEEKKVDRWQVYANVAPVYYNTLGKGSHIDDQFVENSKSGEVNMSYGVNVSYAINNKLKLRTGVSTLDLSYDTDNVILYESVGVNYNGTPRNITLNSTGQSFTAISANNLGAQQLSDLVGGDNNAAISQRIAYYEVPLELEYSLLNSKFGLNIFGGFSTFFLEDNQIYSEFDGYKTEVGEANNINSVSFSGNIGLGLDYKFSDKILFNILPTFKYQLNAYKNTSGNFRPYIIGLYTGLSYKF